MIGDMNEKAAVPAVSSMVPKIIPMRIERAGRWENIPLHLFTDQDIEWMASRSNTIEAWRWARSTAWLLAGLPPRRWEPTSMPTPALDRAIEHALHQHLPQQMRARNAIREAEKLSKVTLEDGFRETLVALVQSACDQAVTEMCRFCHP